jgi:hypothetical protein
MAPIASGDAIEGTMAFAESALAMPARHRVRIDKQWPYQDRWRLSGYAYDADGSVALTRPTVAVRVAR